MYGKTTTLSIVFLLCLFPLWIGAQSAALNCSFDQIHRQRLAGDAAYQRAQRQVESTLLRQARERLLQARVRDEDPVYHIPVVVHLFYPPGTPEGSMSRPTINQVKRSIGQLNDGFRNRAAFSGGPQYSDAGIPAADIGIEFYLAARAPDGSPGTAIFENPTLLANRPIDEKVGGVEVLDSLRRLSGWPPGQYLNIYVLPDLCDQNGNCPVGFAYQAAAHGRHYDGVHVFSKALISENEILLHEVGHYLNLYHTFETGCEEEDCLTGGDRVCDTPPDCYPTRCSGQIPNCLAGERQNTCTNDARIANSPFTRDVQDLYENFMDYGFWKCFNSFTPGQRTRMRDALLLFRSSLLEPLEKDTCRIEAISLLSLDSCLSEGDSGFALLRIDYIHPPDSGKLIVNGLAFEFGDSPQYIPLPVSTAEFPQAVEAFFSTSATCRYVADSLLWAPPCLPECPPAFLLAVDRSDSCAEETWFTLGPTTPASGTPETCAPYQGYVQWVQFVVPETGELRLSARSTADSAALAAAVYVHCDSVPLTCSTAGAGEKLTLSLWDMVPGDTLRAAVWPAAGPVTAPIGLCAYLPVPLPLNDECSGALWLPLSDPQLGQTCNSTRLVEWTGALNSPEPTTCQPAGSRDVWFYTVVPEPGALRIRALGQGASQTGIAAYDHCAGTLLACSKQGELSGVELLIENLEPHDTVWLRVYPLTPDPDEVRLCATIPAFPAPNNYCEQAVALPVAGTAQCAEKLFAGNLIVNSSGIATDCDGDPVEDLWYQVVVPAGGQVIIEAEIAAGILSPGLAAYRNCGGELLACNMPEGEQAMLILKELPPGDTVYIALWDFFRFQFGSASLCARRPSPVNNDCQNASALPLCPDPSCTPMVVKDLQLIAPANSLPGPECSTPSSGELWYKTPVPDNGRLLLELFPGPESVAGLSVYLNCQSRPLGCIDNTRDEDLQLLLTGLPPGDTLLIAVWSVSDSAGIRATSPSCNRFDLSLLVDPISCYQARDGKASLFSPDTSFNYSYRWSTGLTGPAISQLDSGNYSVTISNALQCRDTLHFSLSDPSPLEGEAESTGTSSSESTGQIRLSASGGTPPYRYLLDERPVQTEATFDSLAAGAYSAFILDANSCSWRDTIIVDLLTALDGLPPNISSLHLLPNPAKDFLRVELDLKRPASIRVALFDLMGKRLQRQFLPSIRRHSLTLPLGSLPSGMYILRIEMEGIVVSRRFVVERN